MSFLRHIGIFICRLYGDDILEYTTPVERWSIKNAKLCSPDDIIAAAVIESFAKSFEDWVYAQFDTRYSSRTIPWSEILPPGCSRYDIDSKLTNTKKSFKIYWKFVNTAGNDKDFHMFVNDVSVTNQAAKEIQTAFFRVKEKHDAIKSAAAKAKAEMERNEAAWNLAESLLGMKRNEFGALVPVKTVEELNDLP